jgi:dihydroorotate dehydrogenase
MSIYKKLIRPTLFKLPTETAHELGINALRYGLSSEFLQNKIAKQFECNEFGELKRFGLTFKNPFGIAAGFDKNAVVANQLSALGFGFIEVGTTTFHPQKGNDKPRLFRLPKDSALINKSGFNNEGTKSAVERLKKSRPNCVLGVNIGKNKDVPNDEAIENYLASFTLACEVADYVAVNVSSPNTPNLRELQKAESLEELLKTLQTHNLQNIPLLVKIAPDLSEGEIEAIVDICFRQNLAGIIATNTTISRQNLLTENVEKFGQGGLSGKPLATRSTEVIAIIYKHSKGKLPIIGVGGIFDEHDAFEKICAGATLLQGYTGFVYQGILFARDINFGLAKLLKQNDFKHLDEAVGSNVL